MDSITQAALGAAIGEALLGKKTGYIGAAAGAIVATIPDLDVAFYLFYSKYEMLSIHRGFSHSILFSILASFLVAFVLKRLSWFQNFQFNRLLMFSWLCLFTHMLLDTFTAYGTQLLLPFSDARIGLDCINIVDPIYTIPLIIGLFVSLIMSKNKSNRSLFNHLGILLSSVYLCFTILNSNLAEIKISQELKNQNVDYDSLLIMPVGIASLNWMGVAKGSQNIFMIKHSILSHNDYEIEQFPIQEKFLSEIDPQVAEKMRWFAKGFYTVEKVGDNIRIFNLQVDMRGIVESEKGKAPTVGYFEVSTKNGGTQFSSGSLAD